MAALFLLRTDVDNQRFYVGIGPEFPRDSSSSRHRCDRVLPRFSRSSSPRAVAAKSSVIASDFLSLVRERIEVRVTNLPIAAYQYGSTPHPPLSSIEEERRPNRPFVTQRSVLVTSDSATAAKIFWIRWGQRTLQPYR